MNRNGILRIGAAAAFALTMLSGDAAAQQKSLKDQLVGTWTAVSNVQTRPDGSKLEPFTTNPKGAFMFAADGHFAFVLLRPDLPRLASNDRLKPTAEEAMAIALGTIAYFGTYTVDEASKTVSLKIDGTTLVNQLGLDQKRVITSISADEMRYRNPSVVGGGEIEFAWKRAR
jgi:hypothetical protein